MRHLNRYILLTTLMLHAVASHAVQLGAAKGSAVFGRPLDLSVQVRLETPAEEAASCFTAEVFQADNKFDAGKVRLDLVPAANGLDTTVRIRSATVVNEPWAKVILRSNCGAKVSRQYDFLTDFAPEAATSSVLAETVLPAATTNANANTGATTAPVSDWNIKRAQAKAKAIATTPKLDVQTAQAPSGLKKAKSIPPTVATNTLGVGKKTTELAADTLGQPRLKLETFELADERQVLLKLSTALVEPTGMRTPEEIQALAQATAVWRAINGMPALVKSPEPVAEVAAPTKVVAAEPKPPVSMPTFMNQKLAGKSEFSNLMVYGLIGLLTLTLACIAWLWLRVRKASRAGYGWLRDNEADDAIVEHEPTQFMHSHFYETTVEDNSSKVSNDEDDVSADSKFDTEPQLEPKPETSTTVAGSTHAEDIFVEVVEDESDTPSVAASAVHAAAKKETKADGFVSALPPHFDDPRLDARVLRDKKKNRELEHKPATTPAVELMDFVLEDVPAKLRAVTTPNTDQIDNSVAAPKPAAAKDENKGNLINFDVFAEPEPLNKSTRFVR